MKTIRHRHMLTQYEVSNGGKDIITKELRIRLLEELFERVGYNKVCKFEMRESIKYYIDITQVSEEVYYSDLHMTRSKYAQYKIDEGIYKQQIIIDLTYGVN